MFCRCRLKPSTRYTYRVKSGDHEGVWSPSFTFRTARPAPDTAIAMYGDMAVTHYNAVSNLLADCTSGRIDIFAHMGDHACEFRCHRACGQMRARARMHVLAAACCAHGHGLLVPSALHSCHGHAGPPALTFSCRDLDLVLKLPVHRRPWRERWPSR